jgi:predicted RNA-binding Zn-ribbon protein involved in translation (DUF1610 family)
MSEQAVVCSGCGWAIVPVGYDGDGKPFRRERCPNCGAALDVPDETEPYYPLSLEPR